MGLRVNPPPKLNRAMIKTGTYTGNGVDNRDIDIDVDLAAKNYPYVIIKCTGGEAAKHRIEFGQGDLSMDFGVALNAANLIQAFTNTGFQIGSGGNVNTNLNTYQYIAFWEEP